MTTGNKVLLSGLFFSVLLFSSALLFSYEDPFTAPWELGGTKAGKVKHKSEETSKKHEFVPKKKEGNIYNAQKSKLLLTKNHVEPPSFRIDGIVWDRTGTGVIISGTDFYRIGDYINKECKISQLVGREVIVSCGENVWKYYITDDE